MIMFHMLSAAWLGLLAAVIVVATMVAAAAAAVAAVAMMMSVSFFVVWTMMVMMMVVVVMMMMNMTVITTVVLAPFCGTATTICSCGGGIFVGVIRKGVLFVFGNKVFAFWFCVVVVVGI